MCGIAGILFASNPPGSEALRRMVAAMRDTMAPRGPDDAGIWLDPSGRCALGHRRLSIIDLSPDGRQPIGNEDGSVQVTFNGELYNFQTLRAELAAQGHRFRSHTDSEILPHLFESLEPSRLERLDGMFAMGIWHRRERRLLLARDPFGKKPLYYAQGPGWLAFASELRAFAGLPGLDATIDRDALAHYLLLQYVPAPYSLYRSVRKLPPGCSMIVDASGADLLLHPVERFFEFKAGEPSGAMAGRSLAELEEELRAAVREAVRKRLVSDVPLGAFLSGGVDSALVAAMITREIGAPLRTFSIGFSGTRESEHEAARRVAEHLGTEHHEQLLAPNALQLVDEIAERLDEPNGDSSCLPTFLLSRYTRGEVTVALSGDGGDELFGGYGRYRDMLLEEDNRWRRLLRRLRSQRPYTPADSYLSTRWLIFGPEQVADLMGGLPRALENTLTTWRRALNDAGRPLLHRMRNLDVETYLPGAVLAKVDRMSMQVGLEVRCPLLDRRVAELAQALPAGACWQPPAQTKHLLKQLASRYLPREWMDRPKMGFGLPSSAWSQEAMLALAHDLLLSSSSRLRSLLDGRALESLIARQGLPGRFSLYQVWPLLILELWLRHQSTTGRDLPG